MFTPLKTEPKSYLTSSFRGNLVVMKIFGVYPYDNWCVFWYTLYAYFFWITCSVPTPTLAVVKLIVGNVDLNKFCETLFAVAETGVTIFKYLPFKNKARDVKRTVEFRLNQKIFNEYDEFQKETIIEHACYVSRVLLVVFGCLCAGTFLSWAVREFFNGKRVLPVEIWLPFDLDAADNTTFAIVYTIVFVGISNTAWDNAAIDSLIASLLYHATAQVKVLKDNLHNLIEKAENNIEKSYNNVNFTQEERLALRNRLIYSNICRCVEHQQAIKQFVNDIQGTLSFAVFSQIIASIIALCTSILQLTFVVPFSMEFLAMLIFIGTMLTQVFIYCYFGEQLLHESSGIVESVYTGDWIELEPKAKRALITLMENSKIPMSVTCGSILPLSFQTFVMVCKRSYSLLTMLNKFK